MKIKCIVTGWVVWGCLAVTLPAEQVVEPVENTVSEVAASSMEDPGVLRGVSLSERLAQGGVTMIFLLLLSMTAVTSGLERLIHLRRDRIMPDGLADDARRLWSEGRYDDLSRLCAERPSTLASIVNALVKHRGSTYVNLSTLAGDLAARDMKQHLQRAHPIAVVATLAPLLGLLGTVIGMIESFEIVAIAGSLGDASLLAGGISKALVTTATGLVIAVPALALYHYFRGRAGRLTVELEEILNELLASWFLEAHDGGGAAGVAVKES
jgi:biopolymer transport protein ExbB